MDVTGMNNDYPRLCGGTFLTLLLQAKEQRTSAREHAEGKSDGLTDPLLFLALIRIAFNKYKTPKMSTFGGNTTDYKKCAISTGTYLPFNLEYEVAMFNDDVINSYSSRHELAVSFSEQYLNIDRDSWLVSALIELIKSDRSIGDDELLYCLENGQPVAKADLVRTTDFRLSAFILGVWHFIVVNRRDNKIGEATYKSWHEKADVLRATDTFTSKIGRAGVKNISVSRMTTVLNETDGAEAFFEETVSDEEGVDWEDDSDSEIESERMEGGIFEEDPETRKEETAAQTFNNYGMFFNGKVGNVITAPIGTLTINN